MSNRNFDDLAAAPLLIVAGWIMAVAIFVVSAIRLIVRFT